MLGCDWQMLNIIYSANYNEKQKMSQWNPQNAKTAGQERMHIQFLPEKATRVINSARVAQSH